MKLKINIYNKILVKINFNFLNFNLKKKIKFYNK